MSLTVSGDLPGGQSFATVVSADAVSVRVDDLICTAHPRWMTAEQALTVADQLRQLATHVACRHCGDRGLVGDDHCCPCPFSDADCVDHPIRAGSRVRRRSEGRSGLPGQVDEP